MARLPRRPQTRKDIVRVTYPLGKLGRQVKKRGITYKWEGKRVAVAWRKMIQQFMWFCHRQEAELFLGDDSGVISMATGSEPAPWRSLALEGCTTKFTPPRVGNRSTLRTHFPHA